jgi:hypothetical protein
VCELGLRGLNVALSAFNLFGDLLNLLLLQKRHEHRSATTKGRTDQFGATALVLILAHAACGYERRRINDESHT